MDVSAERSRGISNGDLSEECALAEDGGVAAAVRLPAVSSTSNVSGGRRPQSYRLVGETDYSATNTHARFLVRRDAALLCKIVVLRLLVPALNRCRHNLLGSINAGKFFDNGRAWLFQILVVIKMEFNLLNQLRWQVL